MGVLDALGTMFGDVGSTLGTLGGAALGYKQGGLGGALVGSLAGYGLGEAVQGGYAGFQSGSDLASSLGGAVGGALTAGSQAFGNLSSALSGNGAPGSTGVPQASPTGTVPPSASGVLPSLMGSTSGFPWGPALTALYGYMTPTGNYAQMADPWGQYRAPFMQKLSDLMLGKVDPMSLDPSYGFRYQQGLDAVQRAQAAAGTLGSGGAMAELMRYGQNFAGTDFANTYNRLAQLAGVDVSSPTAAAENQMRADAARNATIAYGLSGIGNWLGGGGTSGGAPVGGTSNIGNILTSGLLADGVLPTTALTGGAPVSSTLPTAAGGALSGGAVPTLSGGPDQNTMQQIAAAIGAPLPTPATATPAATPIPANLAGATSDLFTLISQPTPGVLQSLAGTASPAVGTTAPPGVNATPTAAPAQPTGGDVARAAQGLSPTNVLEGLVGGAATKALATTELSATPAVGAGLASAVGTYLATKDPKAALEAGAISYGAKTLGDSIAKDIGVSGTAAASGIGSAVVDYLQTHNLGDALKVGAKTFVGSEIGSVIGDFVGGPIGGSIGSVLGSFVGNLFGGGGGLENKDVWKAINKGESQFYTSSGLPKPVTDAQQKVLGLPFSGGAPMLQEKIVAGNKEARHKYNNWLKDSTVWQPNESFTNAAGKTVDAGTFWVAKTPADIAAGEGISLAKATDKWNTDVKPLLQSKEYTDYYQQYNPNGVPYKEETIIPGHSIVKDLTKAGEIVTGLPSLLGKGVDHAFSELAKLAGGTPSAKPTVTTPGTPLASTGLKAAAPPTTKATTPATTKAATTPSAKAVSDLLATAKGVSPYTRAVIESTMSNPAMSNAQRVASIKKLILPNTLKKALLKRLEG